MPRSTRARLDLPAQRPVHLELAATVHALTLEFRDRIEPEVVTQVVQDSYDRLIAHVPRTAHVYLLPWARTRLLRRAADRREPTLVEMLATPAREL